MVLAQESRIIKFLLIFSLFILSLENHGINRVLFIVIPLIIFSIYFLYVKASFIVAMSSIKLVVMISLFSLLSFFSVFFYKENIGDYSSLDFFYRTTFKVFIIFLFYNVVSNNRVLLISIIENVLLLHLCCFFIQFFVVYISGYYIDLLEPFTGISSRYGWSLTLPFLGETYRPTGFFNEPSTYASIVFTLLCTKYFISENLTKIDKAVLISLILSLSFASIAMAMFFLILINLKGRDFYKVFPYVLAMLLVLTPLIIAMFQLRTSGNYDALGIRFQLLNSFFSQDFLVMLFGSGPVGVPDSLAYLYTDNIKSWTSEGVAAINDNGLGFFLLIKFGFIGVFFFFSYCGIRAKSVISLLCFMLLFLTKLKFTSFIFIFVIFTIIILGGKKRYEI